MDGQTRPVMQPFRTAEY